jgi:UDP-GlcNAc:undecaprenyl-phosphate GlcNAc-1-phosphate transferase
MAVLAIAFGLVRDGSMRAILIGALIIFVFGLWDDARGLSAPPKLAGQLLAAGLLVITGLRIQVFETEGFFFSGSGTIFFILDIFLTIFWLVGVTNAFNLVDSMDGLVAGLSAWAFGFFMLATFDSNQMLPSQLSALLVGTCIGLIFYNTSPARLFLGDSGAQTLGFFMAAIAILYSPKGAEAAQMSSWFVPILLVGVPIFDTTLVTISRLRRGVPFYIGRGDHTYHRLVKLGLAPSRAVMSMHIAALLLECIAFIAVALPPLPANLTFAGCLAAGVILILILDHPRIWRGDEMQPDQPSETDYA